MEKTVLSTKIGFGQGQDKMFRSGELSTRSRNPSEMNRTKKTGGGTAVNDYLRVDGKSPRNSPSPAPSPKVSEAGNTMADLNRPSRPYAYQQMGDILTPHSPRESKKTLKTATKDDKDKDG